jgi:prepilin-type processing-associated H-X9-DG protein
MCALILTSDARAADAIDPAAPVAPFVNNFTFGVIRVEVPGIDFDALGGWTDEMLGKFALSEDERKVASQALHNSLTALHRSADEFAKAGGKTIWVVLSIEQFPQGPGFMVVPLDRDADAQAIKRLFDPQSDSPDIAFQTHGALVIPLDRGTAEGWKKLQAQPRPELASALTAAGNGRIQVALVPSDDARKVLESMLPSLPGGQPGKVLTQGLIWAAAAIQLPPSLSAHAIIQSDDNAAAQKLKEVLGQLKKPDTGKMGEGIGFVWSALIDAANRAKIQGNQIVLDLDQKEATAVAGDLGALVQKTRDRASRMISMNNMRQIILGCYNYAENHNKKWPASMDELSKMPDLSESPQIFNNPRPRKSGGKSGYVYLPPKDLSQVKDVSRLIVLYEAYDDWDGGIGVGYADGHVEFVQNQAEFKKQLAAQGEK